jgi:epoxyqueuosine reductase
MTEAPAQADRHQLAAAVKRRGRELGFDLVGITDAQPSRYRAYLRQWLDEGQAGSMEYLANRFDERTDPSTYLPGARSVICVALNYYVPLEPLPEESRSHAGKVARYALGRDYHEVIKRRLYELADSIRAAVPEAQTKTSVDTAPVMEKELAARAGIGWIGKNTCLINPDIGSWVLLGEVITTAELAFDTPGTDRCGTCRRCIDACPTGAITAPYQLDARRCISYLTIEHRGEMPVEYEAPIGEWVYGCDICQDVCPWNSKAMITTDPALQPRFPTGTINLDQLLTWRQPQYPPQFSHSAMKRVKLPVLQRNAAIVAGNLAVRT